MISNLLGLNSILSLPVWLQIVLYAVLIIGGMFCLIKGADAFVSGASGIAQKLKVPAIIIGLTIVSIGTSLPEASVSISSAIQGSADISIGNIVGSNMFNLLIVLGISIAFVPIILNRKLIFKDFVLMLVSGALLLIFALFGTSGNAHILSRIECGILFAIFIGYIVYSIYEARQANKLATASESTTETAITTASESENGSETKETAENSEKTTNLSAKNAENSTKTEIAESNANTAEAGEVSTSKNILLLILGLVGIVLGGDFVVFGAQNFAIQVGMSEILVGLTIVAIGTSLPELVTSIVAAKKGEKDIALGNVIGSNIFNVLFILGLSGLITPLAVSASALIDIIIMVVVFVAFLVFAIFAKKLPRYLGCTMIGLYVAYLTYIILRDFVLIA